MTVLHFIKNLDKNNLSGLFMNDLLKGGIDKTTTHILTMSVNDNMEDLMKHATVYRLSRKIWSARANWLKLESIVKSIRPDIIHIHSGSISVLAEVSMVAHKHHINKIIVHSHCAAESKTLKYRIIKFISLPILNHCPTDYLACSKVAGECKYSKKIVRKKLVILKNGVDLKKFEFNEIVRKQMRKELGISGGCPVFLYTRYR